MSFPFFVFLVLEGSLSFGKFVLWDVYNNYWWLAFFFVFLVKLPAYGVHLWLPKAHVEAPVSGSMVLAGVLLKLGAYGILRFGFGLGLYISLYKGYLFSWGLIGGAISCFLCLRQVDLKAYVAYSSVCHMGFGLAGLMSGAWLGWGGGILMMVAHGFGSSCLFYILFVFYERFHSRSGVVLKGIGGFIPLLSAFWFGFCVLNMGVPPSLSFFSEFMISSGLFSSTLSSFVFSFILLLFSGVYGIFMYTVCCHGGGIMSNASYLVLNGRESSMFFFHFFFLLFMIFSLEFFF